MGNCDRIGHKNKVAKLFERRLVYRKSLLYIKSDLNTTYCILRGHDEVLHEKYLSQLDS